MAAHRDAWIGAAALLLLTAIDFPTHVRWYRADLLPPDDFAGYAAAIAHVQTDVALYGRVPRWCPRMGGGAPHFMSTLKERLAAPLVPLVGPTRAAKLFAIALRTLAAVAFYLAFVQVTKSRSAALPAAYVYGYGPQSAHFAVYGHLDTLLALVLLPGIVVAAVETVLRPERLPRVILGVLLALIHRANLIAWQSALLLVLLVAASRPAMDGETRPPLPRALWRTGEALLVFAALAVAPLLWLVLDVGHHLQLAPYSAPQLFFFSLPSPLVLVNRGDWLLQWLPHLYDGVFAPRDAHNACYVGVTVLAGTAAAIVVGWRWPPFARWMVVTGALGIIQLILAHGPNPLAAAFVVRDPLWRLTESGKVEVTRPPFDAWPARIAGIALMAGAIGVGRRGRGLLVGLGAGLLAATIPWFLVFRTIIPLWSSLRSPAHFADTLVLATAWAFGMSIFALERVLTLSSWRRGAASLLVLMAVAFDLWPSHRNFLLGSRLSPLERSVEALTAKPMRAPSRRVLPIGIDPRRANLVLESLPATSARTWVRWEGTVLWAKLLKLAEQGTGEAKMLRRAARIDRYLVGTRDAETPIMFSGESAVYPEAWWLAPVAAHPPRQTIVPQRTAPEHMAFSVPPHEQIGRIVLSEAYHPWWQATVDGEPVPVKVARVALMAIDVPPGGAHVRLDFEVPGILWAAELVDRVAWGSVVLVAAMLLWSRWRRGGGRV